jgi:hypothetical protein
MQEGVKTRLRLEKDINTLKSKEKDSCAGIPKMQLESLDPNAAYKRYRQEKKRRNTTWRQL